MKPYILVQIQKDLTVRSTYCEVEAPEYMYSKWENLMLQNPQVLGDKDKIHQNYLLCNFELCLQKPSLNCQ